jgi:hypothetical protein
MPPQAQPGHRGDSKEGQEEQHPGQARHVPVAPAPRHNCGPPGRRPPPAAFDSAGEASAHRRFDDLDWCGRAGAGGLGLAGLPMIPADPHRVAGHELAYGWVTK